MAPEILRTNLSNVILVMKASGVDDVVNFDYFDPPSLDCLAKDWRNFSRWVL